MSWYGQTADWYGQTADHDFWNVPAFPNPFPSGTSDDGDDEVDDYEKAMEKERAALHAAYRAQKGGRGDTSIVGTYIVDCDEIKDGWPEHHNLPELTVSIKQTKLPGIYAANFVITRFRGVMMLSADREALGFFRDEDECLDVDRNTERGAGVDFAENILDAGATSSDRKPSIPAFFTRHGEATDTAEASSEGGQSTTYFLCLRSMDTGTGEKSPDPQHGKVTFANDLTSFSGTLGIDCVGENVPWSGRKVSSEAELGEKWEDYSWAAYWAESTARWH